MKYVFIGKLGRFEGLFPGFRCEHLIRNFPTSVALADVKVELLFMFLEDKRNFCTVKWITCTI